MTFFDIAVYLALFLSIFISFLINVHIYLRVCVVECVFSCMSENQVINNRVTSVIVYLLLWSFVIFTNIWSKKKKNVLYSCFLYFKYLQFLQQKASHWIMWKNAAGALVKEYFNLLSPHFRPKCWEPVINGWVAFVFHSYLCKKSVYWVR